MTRESARKKLMNVMGGDGGGGPCTSLELVTTMPTKKRHRLIEQTLKKRSESTFVSMSIGSSRTRVTMTTQFDRSAKKPPPCHVLMISGKTSPKVEMNATHTPKLLKKMNKGTKCPHLPSAASARSEYVRFPESSADFTSRMHVNEFVIMDSTIITISSGTPTCFVTIGNEMNEIPPLGNVFVRLSAPEPMLAATACSPACSCVWKFMQRWKFMRIESSPVVIAVATYEH
jgi:hypothetical protein